MSRLLLGLSFSMLWVPVAFCETCIAKLTPLVLDSEESDTDTSPPSAIHNVDIRVSRGHLPSNCSDDCPDSDDDFLVRACEAALFGPDCSNYGTISLNFEPAVDNRTPGEEMGYRVKLVGGELPKGLELPDHPVLAKQIRESESVRLGFDWHDGYHSDRDCYEDGDSVSCDTERWQDPFWFEIEIVPVDLAGLEGAPLLVTVEHAGREADDGMGCSFSRRSVGLGPLLLGLTFLVLLRAFAFRARTFLAHFRNPV